ncbi:MAG TPA: hypothetical protein DCS93_19225 [Microscillaceae bacterium]|nr:hypothetical protein [Microscillaceae bacterium]
MENIFERFSTGIFLTKMICCALLIQLLVSCANNSVQQDAEKYALRGIILTNKNPGFTLKSIALTHNTAVNTKLNADGSFIFESIDQKHLKANTSFTISVKSSNNDSLTKSILVNINSEEITDQIITLSPITLDWEITQKLSDTTATATIDSSAKVDTVKGEYVVPTFKPVAKNEVDVWIERYKRDRGGNNKEIFGLFRKNASVLVYLEGENKGEDRKTPVDKISLTNFLRELRIGLTYQEKFSIKYKDSSTLELTYQADKNKK